MITLASIHSYPVKSCRGIQHQSALLTSAGLEHDREWMFVSGDGRFITQRDEPRLAQVEVSLLDGALGLSAASTGGVEVPFDIDGPRSSVAVWGDRCVGVDQGDAAAAWIGALLGREARLLRFDPARPGAAIPRGPAKSKRSACSDGFPLLVVSRASLDD